MGQLARERASMAEELAALRGRTEAEAEVALIHRASLKFTQHH